MLALGEALDVGEVPNDTDAEGLDVGVGGIQTHTTFIGNDVIVTPMLQMSGPLTVAIVGVGHQQSSWRAQNVSCIASPTCAAIQLSSYSFGGVIHRSK